MKVSFVVVVVFNKPWLLILHLMEIGSQERNLEEGLAVFVLTFLRGVKRGGKPVITVLSTSHNLSSTLIFSSGASLLFLDWLLNF